MSIHERLKDDRYGKHIIFMPTRDECKPYINLTARQLIYKLRKNNIYLKLYNIYTKPYTQYRHSKTYNQLIQDYKSYHNYKSKSWTFIVNLMYKRYLYFKSNQQYYQHSFDVFSTSWYVSSLFQMRKAIMKQMVMLELIPPLRDFNAPYTNGFYKLVKPMQEKHTKLRAEYIYELFSNLD